MTIPPFPASSPPAASRWRDQPAPAASVSDYIADLLWPRVLRSAAYGLRAGRLGLGFFAVVIAALLLGVGQWLDRLAWGARPPMGWMGGSEGMFAWSWYVHLPWRLVSVWPLTTLVVGPLLLVAWLTLLAAISRLTACEVSQGRFLSWWEGLAFAVARWKSILGAVLGPLVFVWLVVLGVAVLGWLGLSWPWLNIVGAVFYFVLLAAGLFAAGVLAVYLLGHNLLIPAIVCEGADAIDAVQRGFAYTLARPVRLAIYLALGVVSLIVVVGIVSAITVWGIDFAARGATAFMPRAAVNEGRVYEAQSRRSVWEGTRSALEESGLGIVFSLTDPFAAFQAAPSRSDVARPFGVAAEPTRPTTPRPDQSGELTRTYTAAAHVVRFWTLIPLVALAGAAVSCGMSVVTVVYLAIRRVCDGQDISEIWWPGAIEKSMAESMAARAKAAPAAPSSGGGDLSKPDYE
jgi:hypothetical protein